MKKMVAVSIISASLLLVGCGSGGSSSSSNNSLADIVSTPAPTATPNTEVLERVVGKGYYVDSAVEGVEYDCGEKHGITDENGTFEFDTDKGCKFRLGEVKLRDLNITALDDNVTVLEDNITVAQLLQTLDADGNASNGIQILDGAREVVSETLTSLEDLEANDTDILEAIHDALKAEYPNEYNGTVVDANRAKEHIEKTKEYLKEHNIKTHYDIIEQRHGSIHIDDINATNHEINGTMSHGENRPDDINITNHEINGTMSHGENRPDDINITNHEINGTMSHGENRPDDINITNHEINGTMSHGENRPDDINITNHEINGTVNSGVVNTQHTAENSMSGNSRDNRFRR